MAQRHHTFAQCSQLEKLSWGTLPRAARRFEQTSRLIVWSQWHLCQLSFPLRRDLSARLNCFLHLHGVDETFIVWVTFAPYMCVAH